MKRHWITAITFLTAIGFAPDFAGAETQTVNQVNLTFVPNDITIQEGDTVEWIHSAGIHTVTNGTGAADPEAGLLFDEDHTAANPIVTYTFDEAGDVPYFCRPHENFGMAGIVRVLPGVTEADEPEVASWSRIKHLYR